MAKLRGTYSVMITPFDASGALDLPTLERFVDWQIEEGIHGLIPLGSTGEFLSLTDGERTAVAESVIKRANGRVPVVIGTGAESTDDVIRYSREAETLGADGVMIIPPFYSTPTPAELQRHYDRIAESMALPIMLYNNPATANVDLTPDIVAQLSRIESVSYIKESTMDVTRVRDIIDFCDGRMTVFGGVMGYESFLNGAEGWVSVGSNLMPKAFARMFTITADDQDIPGARAVYRDILPIIRAVGGHRYVSATKAGLARMGMPVGDPRPPRLPLPDEDRRALDAVLDQLELTGNLANRG